MADLQRLAGCSVETDHAVAVQVLLEDRLQRLQCGACSRYGAAGQISFVVAVAVGAPHRVLAGTGILPGNVIAARRLNRADRRPRAKLTGGNVGAFIFQRRTRSAAAVQIIVVRNLGQAGGSIWSGSP